MGGEGMSGNLNVIRSNGRTAKSHHQTNSRNRPDDSSRPQQPRTTRTLRAQDDRRSPGTRLGARRRRALARALLPGTQSALETAQHERVITSRRW
jgi:hypothetical protein